MLARLLGAILMQIIVPTAPPINVPDLPQIQINITAEPVEVPRSDLYRFLATAAHNVNQLPDDITRQDNMSLIPNSNPAEVFSYAKWLFSYSSAEELMGRTLAPVGMSLFVLFTIMVSNVIVQMIIRIVTPILKIVVWIIFRIIDVIKLLPFI